MGLGGFLFSKNHRDWFTSGSESQDVPVIRCLKGHRDLGSFFLVDEPVSVIHNVRVAGVNLVFNGVNHFSNVLDKQTCRFKSALIAFYLHRAISRRQLNPFKPFILLKP